MIIGYGRTSTTDQTAGLESQDRDLRHPSTITASS
jgi:DNA invertase Pin-like site-specific DNA recombinase